MRISDWSSDVCSSDLAVGELIGAHRQIGLARRGGRIAVSGLEIGRQPLKRFHIAAVVSLLRVVPLGNAFKPGEEDMWNRFIAMNVHGETDEIRSAQV